MILLTGGAGLLGQELQKHLVLSAPPRNEFDIIDFREQDLLWGAELIVHCAAYTDVTSAETNKQLCYDTNVIGTRNLATLGIPILYISTEYVFDGTKGNYNETAMPNPQNFYAFTKLLGEYECRKEPRSVVIRCLFKPRPFEHSHACIDQFTSGDYVDVIAQEIAQAIKQFDNLPATIHIGTGRKSTYELARQTRDVEPCSVADIKAVRLPRDTSMDISLWERVKHGIL